MIKINKINSSLIAISLLMMTNSAFAYDMSEKAIADRIAPIGQVVLSNQQATPETASAPSEAKTPEGIYNTFCVACHGTGVAGAPKLGDKAAWEPRIAQGRDILNNHALQGFNAMPAKGTCMDCSDEEIIKTIDYMISQ